MTYTTSLDYLKTLLPGDQPISLVAWQRLKEREIAAGTSGAMQRYKPSYVAMASEEEETYNNPTFYHHTTVGECTPELLEVVARKFQADEVGFSLGRAKDHLIACDLAGNREFLKDKIAVLSVLHTLQSIEEKTKATGTDPDPPAIPVPSPNVLSEALP